MHWLAPQVTATCGRGKPVSPAIVGGKENKSEVERPHSSLDVPSPQGGAGDACHQLAAPYPDPLSLRGVTGGLSYDRLHLPSACVGRDSMAPMRSTNLGNDLGHSDSRTFRTERFSMKSAHVTG